MAILIVAGEIESALAGSAGGAPGGASVARRLGCVNVQPSWVDACAKTLIAAGAAMNVAAATIATSVLRA